VSSRRGLPQAKRMRHDYHFVEELASRFDQQEIAGRNLPVDRIVTNPHQPRNDLGDLDELVASIHEKGVLQPLMVREEANHYTLVCGERRLRAAQKAGLGEVPCLVVDVDDDEMLELALIENLQRKDLSLFEEADGLKQMADEFGYTHQEIAQRIGRSRTAVTETLKVCQIPPEVRALAEKAGLGSKTALLQIARENDPNRMVELVDRLGSGELVRREDVVRQRRGNGKGKGRPRNFIFRFAPERSGFALNLKFNRAKVSRQEVIRALRAALEQMLELEDD